MNSSPRAKKEKKKKTLHLSWDKSLLLLEGRCQNESSAVWGVVQALELLKAVGCMLLPRPSQVPAVLERQNEVDTVPKTA